MIRKIKMFYFEFRFFRLYGNEIIKSIYKSIRLINRNQTHVMPKYMR